MIKKYVLLAAALFASTGAVIAQTPAPPAPARLAGFGAGMTSEELAKQPQTPGAKGDQQRHYYFAAARKEMPYRLYVPQSYDKKKKTPLVVALHGFGGNQNYFFSFVDNLQALCDKYGFIYVAPLGYSTGSWYGAPLHIPSALPQPPRQSDSPPRPPLPEKSPEQERRERDWSEADVLNVLELVRKEYTIDTERTYLMGHSMGGYGTWFLGQKYPDKWAAIAPMSGTMLASDYQLDKLAKIPVLVSVGSTETSTVASSKEVIERMRKLGMTTEYLEVEGATHLSMIGSAAPKAFEFLAKYKKK